MISKASQINGFFYQISMDSFQHSSYFHLLISVSSNYENLWINSKDLGLMGFGWFFGGWFWGFFCNLKKISSPS